MNAVRDNAPVAAEAVVEEHQHVKKHTKSTTTPPLKAHPLAELLPDMQSGELVLLQRDIAKHGMREPIWLYQGKILDGRHRYHACRNLGLECATREFTGDDPASFVLTMNVYRRHLNNEQRRKLIKDLLKATPEKSNRAIALLVKADDKTVGVVRAELEATAEIPQTKRRTGRDGKSRSSTSKARRHGRKSKAAEAPKRSSAERADQVLGDIACILDQWPIDLDPQPLIDALQAAIYRFRAKQTPHDQDDGAPTDAVAEVV